ncbi:MAG: HAMP domain-containing sensor histidine kinase, partial [Thermoanaerobaculia bacterium]
GRVRIAVVADPVSVASAARVATSGSATLTVSGVPAELKAVLQALVVNAVEASPWEGEVVIRVAERDSGGVRMQIADQGPGLSKEVRARLFEPHVTTKPHGSGMGLFLAHRLVSGRYGGDLKLEPRPQEDGGAGTTAILDIGDRAR